MDTLAAWAQLTSQACWHRVGAPYLGAHVWLHYCLRHRGSLRLALPMAAPSWALMAQRESMANPPTGSS